MSEKLQVLRAALAAWQLDALLLNRRDNVAWLTEGASYYVVERAETGVASLLVTADAVTLLAPDNEMPRILAEEPLPFTCETRAYPWYVSLEATLKSLEPLKIGSDIPLSPAINISHKMPELRQGLNSNEKQRFRALGREAADLVEDIARQLETGLSEREVEAEIAKRCLERGIRPVCTLIAADERIAAFKHPVPGETRLSKKMLITLGAERDGLNVSLTRMVHFGQPAPALRQRIRMLAEIHADILTALQIDRSWQAIFADTERAYRDRGWPESWREHHQGGPAGYGCRDWIVTPQTPGQLKSDTAQAWNPTLKGVKSEDTLLLTDGGQQWLTRSGNWPLIEVTRGSQRWELADWLVLPS
ncbi:M24 family metallopeptidase [Erwinia sp. P7711]|uniref:M24 family metallopeptidase n=1 Tax=Erwinia sp. P7711 TaxID=3141451 RepID=UPI003185E818